MRATLHAQLRGLPCESMVPSALSPSRQNRGIFFTVGGNLGGPGGSLLGNRSDSVSESHGRRLARDLGGRFVPTPITITSGALPPYHRNASRRADCKGRRRPLPKVLVIGFDYKVANHTCHLLRPLPCAQWPAVRIDDDKDGRMLSIVRAGYILTPAVAGFGRGNLGLALAHITAWQHVARKVAACRGHSDAPTLIMEEDERVLQPPKVRALLRSPRSAFDYDLFNMNVLRPKGRMCSMHVPHDRVRCVEPPKRLRQHGAVHTELPHNVWMGAYALRPSGAARLLQLLQLAPPDVSRMVLDVWVARQVADEMSGLKTCVWNTTNDIFQHGDERISLRRGINGGIEAKFDKLMRFFRTDTSGHPQWLSHFAFLGMRFDDCVRPLTDSRAACDRLEACFYTLGFWHCACLGGVSQVVSECLFHEDDPAVLREAAIHHFAGPLSLAVVAFLCCQLWGCRQHPNAFRLPKLIWERVTAE